MLKKYSSNILRYMNIYEYIQYIYMICHKKVKYYVQCFIQFSAKMYYGEYNF